MEKINVTRIPCESHLKSSDVLVVQKCNYVSKNKKKKQAEITIRWEIVLYHNENGLHFIKVLFKNFRVDFMDSKKQLHITPFSKMISEQKDETLFNFVEVETSNNVWKDNIVRWNINSAMMLKISHIKIDLDTKEISITIN